MHVSLPNPKMQHHASTLDLLGDAKHHDPIYRTRLEAIEHLQHAGNTEKGKDPGWAGPDLPTFGPWDRHLIDIIINRILIHTVRHNFPSMLGVAGCSSAREESDQS